MTDIRTYSKESQVGNAKPEKKLDIRKLAKRQGTPIESPTTPKDSNSKDRISCPKCQRTFIYYRSKTNTYLCRTCGEVWTRV